MRCRRSYRSRSISVALRRGSLTAACAMLTLLAGSDESRFVCQHHRLDSVAEAELGKDPCDVGPDDRLGHDQLLGDLGV